MLFAEGDSTLITVLMAVMGTVSLGGIVGAVVSILKVRSEGTRGVRTDTLAEWKDIVEQYQATAEKVEKELGELRHRDQECQLRCTKMESRIGYLESILEDKEIRFRSSDSDGSHTHPPMPKKPDEGAKP